MVALRAWLGTHERGDTFFHGRSSRVIFLFDTLLEPVLGKTKLRLTLLLLLMILRNALRNRTPV